MSVSPPDAEAIWQEFHESLFGFIYRRVQSRETAEDVFQDVMLRIHCNAAGLERAEAVGAWVHQIARNAIADHYRNPRIRRELAAGLDVDDEPPGVPEGAALDVAGELAGCLAPLLKQLPATYREALTLTEVEGLSQSEAAARAGLSLSGMKSRVQRARRQLKYLLIDCCEVELDRRRGITGYRPRRSSCHCDGTGRCVPLAASTAGTWTA